MDSSWYRLKAVELRQHASAYYAVGEVFAAHELRNDAFEFDQLADWMDNGGGETLDSDCPKCGHQHVMVIDIWQREGSTPVICCLCEYRWIEENRRQYETHFPHGREGLE